MNVSQLSLRDLEYIVTVGHELHFGRAAIRLNVSQPTLSEQIKKLESLLELKIFERSKKSVQLTPQGVALIELGKNILKQAQQFIDFAQNKKGPLCGEFHLAAIATVGPYYFSYLIAPLKKNFPHLELILHEGQTDELLHKLNMGELDAVIASRTFDEKNYRIYPLYNEPFWLAAPTNMKLNLKLGKISVKDIEKDKLLLLTEGNCLKDEVLNFCSLSKNKISNKIQATSLETLCLLVASGNGCTFIPQLALEEDIKLKGLIKYYPLLEKSAYREIALVTREQYAKPDQIRLLYKAMKEHLPKFY